MDSGEPASDTFPTNHQQADEQTTQETHTAINTTTNITTTAATAVTTADDDDNKARPASQLLEDEQEVIQLYQKSPPHLWPVFNNVLQFCDAVDEEVMNYTAMIELLTNAYERYEDKCPVDSTAVAQFAAAAGFVKQAVKVLRTAITGGAMFGSNHDCMNPLALCSTKLLIMLINFTYFDNRIRFQMVKTGVFHDFVECLKMFRESSPETEPEFFARLGIVGIMLNCSMNPEVAAAVNDMGIVPYIEPFLDKRQSKDIRLASLFLLAHIVGDTQLDCLEMDHDLLEQSLHCIKQALEPTRKYDFKADDTANALSLAARLGFNKRLIVAEEGAVEMFKTVLQKGTQEDIHAVLAIFVELAADPINAGIFQRDKELVKVLTALRDEEHGANVNRATKIIAKIQEGVVEEDDFRETPALADVLANQSNALIILNVGKVEFVLNRLADFNSGRGSRGCQVTEVKIVKALRELANHESCRREIMARGGIRLLQKLLQRDDDHDRVESINLLLVLASCKEYSILIQATAGLMESVQRLTRHDNHQVRQAANQLVDVVRNPSETIITSTHP